MTCATSMQLVWWLWAGRRTADQFQLAGNARHVSYRLQVGQRSERAAVLVVCAGQVAILCCCSFGSSSASSRSYNAGLEERLFWAKFCLSCKSGAGMRTDILMTEHVKQ